MFLKLTIKKVLNGLSDYLRDKVFIRCTNWIRLYEYNMSKLIL